MHHQIKENECSGVRPVALTFAEVGLCWVEQVSLFFDQDCAQVQELLSSCEVILQFFGLLQRKQFRVIPKVGTFRRQFFVRNDGSTGLKPFLQSFHVLVIKYRSVELILCLGCFSKYFLANIEGIVVKLYADLTVRVNPTLSLPGGAQKLHVYGVASLFWVLVVYFSHRFLCFIKFPEIVDAKTFFIVSPLQTFAIVGDGLVAPPAKQGNFVSIIDLFLVPIPGVTLREMIADGTDFHQFLFGRVSQGDPYLSLQGIIWLCF